MKTQKARQAAEIEALRKTPDTAINTSDIPEISDWGNAERGRFYRPIKQPIQIRIDADVVAWFKTKGKGYQTKMNKALREYMERHRN
ncbi:MAG: BrnA antitoxin family protein [Gammaproteobacteria bacterium]|nr:BrnA antitoxin family protein [Gammaproteobacteria bacterium]